MPVVGTHLMVPGPHGLDHIQLRRPREPLLALGLHYQRGAESFEQRNNGHVRETRLQPARSDFDAAWVSAAIGPFGDFNVASLVPAVFAAYGRILHPARGRDGVPVRWDSVAAWSGRRTHRLVEFDRAAHPQAGVAGPAPYVDRPEEGALPLETLSALCGVLARHTATPDDCYFGVWEGYPWIDPWRERASRLRLPERAHLMFEGPLSAIDDLGWTTRDGRLMREAPSCIWPADRSWFVASDIDQDSTYVGGTPALIEGIVGDPRLEAWRVQPTDPITAGQDTIND